MAAFLSATFIPLHKTVIPTSFPSRNPKLLTTTPLSRPLTTVLAAATGLVIQDIPPPKPPTTPTTFREFASKVSGEWDGFGADFTPSGEPLELPEYVVPEAFREWEVRVFDWQTQCPTLAEPTLPLILRYKTIKLLPTVGCEADAATRHTVDERDSGSVLGLGYDGSGSYVAVWPVGGRGVEVEVEVEHCLVDRDREVRVRVVQVVRVGEGGMRVVGIKAFSEQWYGPFRNGEQLGGCSIRESGFAATEKVRMEEVVGEWQGMDVAVTSFGGEQKDIFRELVVDRPQKSTRDQVGLVPLPKQLWCSFKEKDGETLGEVGWFLNHGCAMISRCAFRQDGSLKEIAIGRETTTLKGT